MVGPVTFKTQGRPTTKTGRNENFQGQENTNSSPKKETDAETSSA